jgi:hypothetical protein
MEEIMAQLEQPQCTLEYAAGAARVCVTVKTCPGIAEISTFVDRVAENCISDDGDYVPEFCRILFEITFMQMFTNLTLPTKLENGEMLVDMETAYKFVRDSKLLARAQAQRPELKDLIALLEDAVREKIAFRKQQLLNLNGDLFYSDMRSLPALDVDMMNNLLPKLQNLDETHIARELVRYQSEKAQSEEPS